MVLRLPRLKLSFDLASQQQHELADKIGLSSISVLGSVAEVVDIRGGGEHLLHL